MTLPFYQPGSTGSHPPAPPDGLAVVQAHLEAIRERHHVDTDHHGEFCAECCGPPWPCPDHSDAVAAIDALVVERERATTRDEQIRATVEEIVMWPESLPSGVAMRAMSVYDLLGAGDGA